MPSGHGRARPSAGAVALPARALVDSSPSDPPPIEPSASADLDVPQSQPSPRRESPSRTGLARVAVALDTDDRDRFGSWCELFGPRVGALKVGLEAFVRWGPEAVVEARRHARCVFLDLKLHDIPNTVAGAVASARRLGVRYLTVHASGGREMLEAAVGAAAGEVSILAVTVLTHLDAGALADLGLPGSAARRVRAWTSLAKAAGVSGVVCSPQELEDLRSSHPRPFLLVTPGIRPASTSADDQRRTATPARALLDGSDLLVIGRPLTRPADSLAALERLAVEIEAALPAGQGEAGTDDQK